MGPGYKSGELDSRSDPVPQPAHDEHILRQIMGLAFKKHVYTLNKEKRALCYQL